MNICFLLLRNYGKPIGGYKLVYQYANRFVENGHHVTICYTHYLPKLQHVGFVKKVKAYWNFLRSAPYGPFPTNKWFTLDSRVKEKRICMVSSAFLPQCDVYIATAVDTSIPLNEINSINPSRKFYFIQGYESWRIDEKDLISTYHYAMNKIVVSKWLHRKLEQLGEQSSIVLNGFDFNYFHLTTPIENRDKASIAMLYHSSEGKGCVDGIVALYMVKQKHPELTAKFFGTDIRPIFLPDWIEYTQTPTKEKHNEIYNSSAIFIGTSYSEGWGLTVGEAMICGCAIVCTNTDGYLEMVDDEKTGLVVPIKSPELMAKAIERLIIDEKYRYQIAHAGHDAIQKFDIDNSYQAFEKVLRTVNN